MIKSTKVAVLAALFFSFFFTRFADGADTVPAVRAILLEEVNLTGSGVDLIDTSTEDADLTSLQFGVNPPLVVSGNDIIETPHIPSLSPPEETQIPTESPSSTPVPPTPTPTAAPTSTPQPANTPAPAPTTLVQTNSGLDPEKLFAMANNHRKSIGLNELQKDSRSCDLAASRAPEISAEIAGGYMHAGVRARNLPYWNSENIITMGSEESAFNWWLNDQIHREAIEGNYTYSCVACSGNACVQEFTNFQPK